MIDFAHWLTETTRPFYDAWGWVMPDGSYYSGDESHDSTHFDILMRKGIIGNRVSSEPEAYDKAYRKGWVRFFREKKSSDTIELGPYESSIRNALKWLRNPGPYTENVKIYIDARSNFMTSLPPELRSMCLGKAVPPVKAEGYLKKILDITRGIHEDNMCWPSGSWQGLANDVVDLESEYGNKYKRAGQTVDGLHVGDEIPNKSSIGATLDEYTTLEGIREVPMADFSNNPRSYIYAADDFKRCDRLADQIRATSIIKPLIVVVEQDGPYILEGAHRMVALIKLGIKYFPALVVVSEDD